MNNKSTLIIYDWDDTLFPTTIVVRNKLGQLSMQLEHLSHVINKVDKIKLELIALDKQIYKLLEKSMRMGYTVIITNASRSWIKETSSKYYPATYSLMMKYNIPVISAREFSSNNDIKDSNEWKNVTFKYFLTTFMSKNNKISNILSFGDSLFEKKALEKYGHHINSNNQNNKVHIKTIKYINTPNVLNLLKENMLIYNNLEHIVNKNGNSDIYLERM
jgi:hypothetical protein